MVGPQFQQHPAPDGRRLRELRGNCSRPARSIVVYPRVTVDSAPSSPVRVCGTVSVLVRPSRMETVRFTCEETACRA